MHHNYMPFVCQITRNGVPIIHRQTVGFLKGAENRVGLHLSDRAVHVRVVRAAVHGHAVGLLDGARCRCPGHQRLDDQQWQRPQRWKQWTSGCGLSAAVGGVDE